MSPSDRALSERKIRQAIGAIEKNVARFYQAHPVHAIRGETVLARRRRRLATIAGIIDERRRRHTHSSR
jgi:hypothetical protein